MHIEQERWFLSPNFATTKHEHMLKITVLKGIRKRLLSIEKIQTSKKNSYFWVDKIHKGDVCEIFIKDMWENILFGQKRFSLNYHFKHVALVYCGRRPERTFLFNVPLTTNLCPIIFTA